MFTQLYSDNSTLSLDFWFDKNVAKISIANKFANADRNQLSKGSKVFDYENASTITMNIIEIQKALTKTEGLINQNTSLDYNKPVVYRKWENTITECFIGYMDSKPAIIIRVTQMEMPIMYSYIFNDMDELIVFEKFLNASINIAPLLGTFYYWEKYMNKRELSQGWNNNNGRFTRNQNNFNNRNNSNFTSCVPPSFNSVPQQSQQQPQPQQSQPQQLQQQPQLQQSQQQPQQQPQPQQSQQQPQKNSENNESFKGIDTNIDFF